MGIYNEGFKAVRNEWKYARTAYQVGVYLANISITVTLFDGNDVVGEDLALVTRIGINYDVEDLPL